MTSIMTVTDDSYESDVSKHKGLMLLDFWAPWCGPCRAIAPLLDELAGEYEGEISIAKINADENPQVRDQAGVRGLPTLIFLRDGVEIERLLVVQGKGRLAAAIEKHLEA